MSTKNNNRKLALLTVAIALFLAQLACSDGSPVSGGELCKAREAAQTSQLAEDLAFALTQGVSCK